MENNEFIKEKNFIYQSYLNLKFLEFYRKEISNNSDITLDEFDKKWYEQTNKIEVKVPTKAIFEAMLYPLLIYPKEVFYNTIKGSSLALITEKFNINIVKNEGVSVIDLQGLLRRMRNSLVHNRMEAQDDTYVFTDGNNATRTDFIMRISSRNLAAFLPSLVDYFVFNIDL